MTFYKFFNKKLFTIRFILHTNNKEHSKDTFYFIKQSEGTYLIINEEDKSKYSDLIEKTVEYDEIIFKPSMDKVNFDTIQNDFNSSDTSTTSSCNQSSLTQPLKLKKEVPITPYQKPQKKVSWGREQYFSLINDPKLTTKELHQIGNCNYSSSRQTSNNKQLEAFKIGSGSSSNPYFDSSQHTASYSNNDPINRSSSSSNPDERSSSGRNSNPYFYSLNHRASSSSANKISSSSSSATNRNFTSHLAGLLSSGGQTADPTSLLGHMVLGFPNSFNQMIANKSVSSNPHVSTKIPIGDAAFVLPKVYINGIRYIVLVFNPKRVCKDKNQRIIGTGCWEFPGGLKNKNETLENTAIRELKEELNFPIKKSTLKFLETSLSGNRLLYEAELSVPTSHNKRVNLFGKRSTKWETSDYGFLTLKNGEYLITSYSGVRKTNQLIFHIVYGQLLRYFNKN